MSGYHSLHVRLTVEQLQRPVPGGIGTYIKGLVSGLHRLDVAEVTGWSARGVDRDVTALRIDVEHSAIPVRVLTRLWGLGLAGGNPAGVSVVHATTAAIPPTKLPLTVTIHDTAWRQFPDAYPKSGARWHEQTFQRALKRADVFFTPSPATVNVLLDEGIERHRIVQIDEGVDHLAAPNHSEADIRLQSLDVDGPFILAVGTLEPRKNLPALISAYQRARRELELPPLLIVGPTGWGDAVAPADDVVLAGKVSEAVLSALYERCHFFVSVPLVEGYGLPAVEAMQAGAPVMSTPVPSVGDAALLVEPDVNSIYIGLVRMSDADLRADLRRRSHRRVQKLRWTEVAQQHLDAWERLS